MNAPELRKLTPEELSARIDLLRSEVFDLRIKHSTQQLENGNTASLKAARRNLARALTVQSERSRGNE